SRSDLLLAYFEILPYCHRRKYIRKIVIAYEFCFHISIFHSLSYLHFEKWFGTNSLADHVRIFYRSIFDDAADSFAHLSKVIVVPHHECESMRETSQVIEEFALCLLHTFDASKSFEVRLAAIGDESMCGQRVCAI